VYGNLALLNLLAVAFSGDLEALRLPDPMIGCGLVFIFITREKREFLAPVLQQGVPLAIASITMLLVHW
jgi:hypothetical protein